jgi:hypothetical protein
VGEFKNSNNGRERTKQTLSCAAMKPTTTSELLRFAVI